ncbi:MAG: hypothetical protein Q8Q33_06050, partial [Chlamydiota bacterium]|nr:hypothetical protein [Chlamydiota bacterium]
TNYHRKQLNRLNNIIYNSSISQKVEKIRELAFIKEPRIKSLSQEAISRYLHQEIEKEYPDIKMEHDRKTLLTFGFIKETLDLKSTLLSLYDEQVGAFYDVNKKTLFTNNNLPFSQLTYGAILAHEMTHALQDQHYEIDRLLNSEALDNNDDAKLAAQALIEGDATLVMQLYYTKSFNIDLLWDVLTFFFMDHHNLNNAPGIIRENMLFPYTYGNSFVLSLYAKNGWKAVNDAYLNPPTSTEQIMHPERFLQHEDNSLLLHVPLPQLDEIFTNHIMIANNTLGEFNIHQLFKHYLGLQAKTSYSEGWGNDRFQIWEHTPDKHLDLIWVSVWDTQNDCVEFYRACIQIVKIKYPDAHLIFTDDSRASWLSSKNTISILKSEHIVVYIEAKDPNNLQQVLDMIFVDQKDSSL